MKFLDKVKNMFTEEVVEEDIKKDEVKIEQIIPEKKQETNTIEEFNHIKQAELKKEEKKPVFFTDDDFNDLDSHFKQEEVPKRNELKKENYNFANIKPSEEPKERIYSSNYNPTKSANDYLEKYNEENGGAKEPYQGNTNIEKKTPKFKPTPIISPVYGILDKNYHKEDIVNKNETSYKAIDGLSVDSIREKAYGTLEDELENTLFGSNSILFNEQSKDKIKNKEHDFFDDLEEETKPDKDDDNLRDLENITMDIGKELDTLLNKDKTETNEDKKTNFDDDDDLFNLIDTMYDGDDQYDN